MSVDLAANIWRNRPRMSEVDCGIVRCLTVLPVFSLHSSAAFLQNSKSWPTVPQETVTVTPAAPAPNVERHSAAAAAATLIRLDFIDSPKELVVLCGALAAPFQNALEASHSRRPKALWSVSTFLLFFSGD